MIDIVSPDVRSKMMAANRRRDTKPELLVRRHLHAEGLRFRLDVRALPGSPDIVLARHRAAIFVHGCYWHHHPGCRFATMPESNTVFWKKKFEQNVERDRKAVAALLDLKWRVAIVWECSLAEDTRQETLASLRRWTTASERFTELSSAGEPKTEARSVMKSGNPQCCPKTGL